MCIRDSYETIKKNYVYGAIIMTKVIARVHPVYLINVEANDLVCESA